MTEDALDADAWILFHGSSAGRVLWDCCRPTAGTHPEELDDRAGCT